MPNVVLVVCGAVVFKKLFTDLIMPESRPMQRNYQIGSIGLSCFFVVLFLGFSRQTLGDENASFRQIAQDYIEQMPAFSPVGATQIGDHRFDGEMDDVSEASRQRTRAFNQGILDRLKGIDRAALSRDLQVDAALLRHVDDV